MENATIHYKAVSGESTLLRTPKFMDFNYDDVFAYRVFPDGLNITITGSDKKKKYISSDYALFYIYSKIFYLKGNVIARTDDGSMLNAKSLYLLEEYDHIFSDEPVTFKKDGSVMKGNSFDSNQALTVYRVNNPNGTVSIKEDEL